MNAHDDFLERDDPDIARAWIDYWSRPHSRDEEAGDDEAWWAAEAVMTLIFDDPVRALEICFLIARQSEDPAVLAQLGAGPMEDLLHEDATLVNAIVLEAPSNRRLTEAMRSMWQGDIPDTTWDVVQRLVASH